MARVDIYQQVTDLIVAELEKGVAPWVQPWKAVGGVAGGLPCNGYTSRPYRGVNVWVLVVVGHNRGYGDPRWFTFRQANLLGAKIRKGEKATLVTLWRDLKVEERNDATGVRTEKSIPLLKSYPVFNALQCEGVPRLELAAERPAEPELRYKDLPPLLERSGAVVRTGGSLAFYSVDTDSIQVPPVSAFQGEEFYWSTMLHELTHWTSHPTRLDRDVKHKFASLGYAAEELVAELGSAYLCASLGVQGELRHPEYLGSWLKAFKDDKRALFRASTLAQRAADFVLQFRPDVDPGHASPPDENAE